MVSIMGRVFVLVQRRIRHRDIHPAEGIEVRSFIRFDKWGAVCPFYFVFSIQLFDQENKVSDFI